MRSLRALGRALIPLALALLAADGAGALPIPSPVKAVRVDPSYLYDLGLDPDATAAAVLDDCAAMGANTVFYRAYNPAFGAFYDTHGYPDAAVEPGFGAADLLGRLLPAAHARGIAVVAWLPVNDFKSAWDAHPDWREKISGGADYVTAPGATLLSVRSAFRPWVVGLVEDLLAHYPAVDGIEAAEAAIDLNWANEADYNPSMTAGFSGSFASPAWRAHVALGLTELHQLLFAAAAAAGKPSFVVQTWTAGGDGHLLPSADIRDGSGFDWDGILDLHPDYAVGELMFQQWQSLFHDPATFGAGWTAGAVAELAARVAGRAAAIAHVEASRIGVQPTPTDFSSALRLALGAPGGADFYDYWLARSRHLTGLVADVYAPAGCTTGACSPGGGSKATDCAAEWWTTPPAPVGGSGIPGKTLSCRRGDPACDAGGDPGACTFSLALCANAHDPHLPACTPSALAAIDVLGPSAARAAKSPADAAIRAALLGAAAGLALGSPDSCSAKVPIVVPLGGTPAAPRVRTATLKVAARTAGGATDVDLLRLRCSP